MVWAALIIGLGSGILFLSSGLLWRFGDLSERLGRGWRISPEEAISDSEARELAERLGTFAALREELLRRAIRAKTENDLDVELDAFRRASETFLRVVGHETTEDVPPR